MEILVLEMRYGIISLSPKHAIAGSLRMVKYNMCKGATRMYNSRVQWVVNDLLVVAVSVGPLPTIVQRQRDIYSVLSKRFLCRCFSVRYG